jgi:hypothetical protein
LIVDDLNQVYRSSQLVPKHTYLNGVFAALSANAPNWIVAALLWKPLRRLRWLESLPYAVAGFFETVKLGKGFLGFVVRGEWNTMRYLFKPGLSKLRSAFYSPQKKNTRPVFDGGPGKTSGRLV